MSKTTNSKSSKRRKSKAVISEHKIKPEVRMEKIWSLRPFAKNARLHSPHQIGQLKASIEAFGFMNPILVDPNLEVIAGHGRLLAATELGLRKVPVIQVDHLSEVEVRGYRLADNKLAENSTWDEALLQIEVSELIDLELNTDLSFDIQTLGFETAEVDLLFSSAESEGPVEIVEGPEEKTICKSGEVWTLGRHRIICGSGLEDQTYTKLMNNEQANLELTDPPYNVRVQGHVRGKSATPHEEFAMASGEMKSDEFTQFLQSAFDCAVSRSAPGAVTMSFMDWRHMTELDAATSSVGLQQINLCVWVKNNGGMGSLYRSQHELCAIYKLPGAKHQNNVQLGSTGRYRTNVWNYAGVNTFGRNRKADLVDHPTVKPIAMIEDAMRDVTRHGDIVLDPFGGSGTTLMAAERCRRVARLIELDPKYVDVTIRRWQDLTGLDAVEETSGTTWNERGAKIDALKEERAND